MYDDTLIVSHADATERIHCTLFLPLQRGARSKVVFDCPVTQMFCVIRKSHETSESQVSEQINASVQVAFNSSDD